MKSNRMLFDENQSRFQLVKSTPMAKCDDQAIYYSRFKTFSSYCMEGIFEFRTSDYLIHKICGYSCEKDAYLMVESFQNFYWFCPT